MSPLRAWKVSVYRKEYRSPSQSFTLDCIHPCKRNEGLRWFFFPCATEGYLECPKMFTCQTRAMLGMLE